MLMHTLGVGKYAAEVWGIWEKFFKKYTCHDLLDILNRHGASATEMLYLDEMLNHPQVDVLNLVDSDYRGRKYLRAPWSGSWENVQVSPSPSLDQDRVEILKTIEA